MLFLYNLIVRIAGFLLKIIAFYSPKIKLFIEGRKVVFPTLEQKIKPFDKTIWFHAASLGEYEQGLPVIEKIKEKFPLHKIVVTFFSPSGYEVRKNNTAADVTVYLPLDTKKNAQEFLKLVHPDLVFFIKYEYWLNYLSELKNQNTPTYLISGILRENQMFFKWYGGFYRKALDAFTYFFVQNENSKKLLLQLGKTNVAVSGDTRFDRVAAILEKNNALDFIANFKNDTLTIVIGSSWPKDEHLIVDFINSNNYNVKFIIAPHNIKEEQIQQLKNSITRKTILFSEKENAALAEYDVLIINTIGILTKIYSYADIAYVGGGFGNPGVHNILEPATFGVPIVIGPNYSHFAEATALVNLEGCTSVSNKKELDAAFTNLILNEVERQEKGHICSTFVQMNKGATNMIMNTISKFGTH
ncbi:3-deoxy-D-manno-octulosonic acid transferase [Flavobacterium gawalongense]|uniref:3-deoxy-D-manno-octulosonic acid transferase n=1 Tax=Flavobacterium gawalongense TaxID=2594432 RepID=A0A553BX81_9FLAO|nr:glycosyltransferase N-terminal domain-containing protein [Flavobacterium gawalongense]TRX04304.1 3-deoxy-D-manno-octulosonic acid transferase [Flavobacterium gawalongense]TRX09426.1 3-deoxy-D-manno-octulosonic acid transferase [Flavobacterium gawalongense]TRX12940.1 3-deoxy-D-manno-octulosonic acid transferase [Flavobacterium gawalongense]TRX13285.1 3-deoxy-D-manno-octulosonic acid transferase [Flavobacterium gawalongense]TRX30835.1 3-deoxy-D-manno-octulosonic acid transferase [Flavobacteri